jgi:hypothetical protein
MSSACALLLRCGGVASVFAFAGSAGWCWAICCGSGRSGLGCRCRGRRGCGGLGSRGRGCEPGIDSFVSSARALLGWSGGECSIFAFAGGSGGCSGGRLSDERAGKQNHCDESCCQNFWFHAVPSFAVDMGLRTDGAWRNSESSGPHANSTGKDCARIICHEWARSSVFRTGG